MIKEDGEIVSAHGWTKLYHPRGPLVSMPVTGDNPAAMFACVSAMLDAGFVVAAPGLEAGEEKEMVSGVLRGAYEHDGEETSTFLLYAANEAMKWSFLKIYLNSDADVQAFESASGLKLDHLPVYEGKDKPERDGGKTAQKYIVKTARPVPVVFKQNPKWSEEESNAAKAQNKLYTKPRRVFVRWADAPASTPAPASLPHAEPLNEMQVAEAAWKVRLHGVVACDDLNKLIPMVKAITEKPIQSRAWTILREFATARGWGLDVANQKFVAELPKPTAPPPPDMAPPDDDHPLIAAWKAKLVPANKAKLKNGELLTAFKSIGKTEPQRGEVWGMLGAFAKENGYDWDGAKFAEVADDGMPDYPG